MCGTKRLNGFIPVLYTVLVVEIYYIIQWKMVKLPDSNVKQIINNNTTTSTETFQRYLITKFVYHYLITFFRLDWYV